MADCQGNPILAEIKYLQKKLREINDILSDPNTTQSNAAFYLSKEESYTNRLTELYTLCNKQYEL